MQPAAPDPAVPSVDVTGAPDGTDGTDRAEPVTESAAEPAAVPVDLSPRPPRPAGPPREEIPTLDAEAIRAARVLVERDWRLGRLADVVVWAAGVQGVCPPRPFTAPGCLVVAGRHDSARDDDVDPVGARIAELTGGGAPGGPSVRVLDTRGVRASAGRIDREDALTEGEAEAAYALGIAAVDRFVDEGGDLLLLGDVDAENGPAVATLASLYSGREPVACVRRGGDARVWARTVETVRDARRRGGSRLGHPLSLLAAVGGADLAALTGVLVHAAARRTPVLLDGAAAAVCGVVAEAHADGCSIWWTAASRSGIPAHELALRTLDLDPLLTVGLGYDGAAGALLALPLLQEAMRLVSG